MTQKRKRHSDRLPLTETQEFKKHLGSELASSVTDDELPILRRDIYELATFLLDLYCANNGILCPQPHDELGRFESREGRKVNDIFMA